MSISKIKNQPIVRLNNVTKTYGEGATTIHALQNVSVDFAKASFTAIMGPSGSGKSTLLQCAAGLDRPSDGRIEVAEIEINSLNETELTYLRRDHIGFVFQAFNLVQSLTAAQNVALPLRLAKKTLPEEAITEALTQVGLSDRAGHLPGELSGGQQQRVAIARALVSRPAVLFADEPTGALDTKASREILGLIRKTVDSEDQTVVMVTHDPIAASYADRVLFLADGKLVGTLDNPTPQTVAARMTQLEK